MTKDSRTPEKKAKDKAKSEEGRARRERIATAILAGIEANTWATMQVSLEQRVEHSVAAADLLIARLDKVS